MIPIRSAISSATLKVWVDIKTAAPALDRSRNRSLTKRAFRVESDHRFVQDQDRRIVKQGRGEDQPLPHSVGIRLGQVVEEVAQLEQIGLPGDPRPGFAAVEPAHLGHELQNSRPESLS